MILKSLSQANVRRWTPWIVGTIAALYVSRVFVEFAPLDWSTPLVWVAALVLGLAGFAVIMVASGYGRRVVPVAVLAVYLISPTIDPRLAVGMAFVAVTGVLILEVGHPAAGALAGAVPAVIDRRWPQLSERSSAELASDAGVFLLSLFVYVATLSPGLLPADSGEFQLVAPTLGIAHPPGYALYTLVGKLFTLIPVGTPAYHLNLLSAVLAAATLVLINATTRRLTESVAAGLVAAVALAGATTFWAQATTANIRMPTAFFAALLLWLLVRYGETRSDRDLVVAAFVFGLGLTHHGSLAFIGVPAVLYVLWLQPQVLRRGRLLARCVAAFALALLVLLYFPIRGAANAPLNPGGLTTIGGFLDHVLARGFSGDVLVFTGRQALADRLPVLFNILSIQFGWPLFLLAAIGVLLPLPQYLISNIRHSTFNRSLPFSRQHWLLLAGSAAIIAIIAITYRAPQTVEYLMPAYVPLAMLMGIGAAGLGRLAPSPALRAMLLAVALALGLANVWHIAPSYRELSRQSDTRQVVEPILKDAPAGATILSNWHWATALWYLQIVEGVRPDVDVQYVAPAGAEPYPETWRRRLADSLGGRAIIVTNRYRTYADLLAQLVPFHDAFLVSTGQAQVPAGATRVNVDFEGTIELQGYRLSATRLESGQELRVHLWWQPLVDARRDYSVFVHLIDAGGHPIGQADASYAAERLTGGSLIEGAYSVPVLPTVAPGDYAVIAGFYFTPAEGGFQRLTTTVGADFVRLGTVTLAPQRTPMVSRHQLEVPFASGLTLVGVDYDSSRPDTTRVYLHWRAGSTGPWTAHIVQSGQAVGSAAVPEVPAGSFVTTAIDAPAGLQNPALRVGASDGGEVAGLGLWRLPVLGSSVRLPAIKPGNRYLIYGGEMALLSADWWPEGNEVVVDLEWIGLQPLVRDYTVSVQLLGESGWRAQHDGTPALGAIPTLKWIRGTRVVDRHRIELPDGATGPAEIQVSVYDAFTQQTLGVLDDRFQRAGQGQAAVIGRVTVR